MPFFQIIDNELQTKAAFDYENKNSYTIRVRAADSGGLSFEEMFTIIIDDINEAQVAEDDRLTVTEDESKSGIVNALTYSLVDDAKRGKVVMGIDGSYTYTPDSDENGADSFTFKANDGDDTSETATLIITVNPVNDPPSFLLALYVMTHNKVSYVSAVREVSVVFAALLGTFVLHEPLGDKKILGSLLIFAGIVFITLAK